MLACFTVTVVIGCTSTPKIKDLSECRYGEDEDELIEELGIGSDIIHFRLGDDEYHYRSFVIGGREGGPVYGLLFLNNKLSVMTKQTSLPFDKCLAITESMSWDTCFSDSIRKMEEERIDVVIEQFSEGVHAERASAREYALGAGRLWLGCEPG